MHSPDTLPVRGPPRPAPFSPIDATRDTMRSLIIGATGFVGRTLAIHLRESGDEVVETGRSSGGPDVADRDAIAALIGNTKPEIVYHLAAQSHVQSSWDDPIGTLRSNVEGTQNVLDAAYDASVRRILVVTSAEIYGSVTPEMQPIAETAPLRPATPYAASKVAAEAITTQAHLGRGQDTIRLRSFNHIGPGQRADFVCAGLAQRIARAERTGDSEIEVGSLEPRRDFTDVRDVVRAYRLAAESGAAGEAYNVCSGIDRSIGEVADGLLELADGQLSLRTSDGLTRRVDTPIVRGDHTKLTDQTGWEPKIQMEDSLRDILEDARKRLDHTS